MRPEQGLDRLLEHVGNDLRPVRPLHLGRRCFPALTALGLAFFGVLWWGFGLRPDHEALGPLALWGLSGLEVGAALLLVGLALREAFPGRSPSIAMLSAAAAIAMALHCLSSWITAGKSTVPIPAGQELDAMVFCLGLELCLGVPIALLAMSFIRRGLVTFPWRVGLLGGFGAGLAGNSLWHLICPYSGLAHTLSSHTAGILAVTGIALLVALLWDRARLRSWRTTS